MAVAYTGVTRKRAVVAAAAAAAIKPSAVQQHSEKRPVDGVECVGQIDVSRSVVDALLCFDRRLKKLEIAAARDLYFFRDERYEVFVGKRHYH